MKRFQFNRFEGEYLETVEKLSYQQTRSYRDYVEFLTSRNPYLANLVNFFQEPKKLKRRCQMTALDFYGGVRSPISHTIPDIDLLDKELRQDPKGHDKHPQGRIIIIEDLTPETIELLGSSLDIDPVFFALHIHTTSRGDTRFPATDDAILPSRLVSQDFMSTTYQSALLSNVEPGPIKKFSRNTCINRKLVFIRSTKIALAQHCTSVLKVQLSSGFWIALLLVDPPVGDIFYPSGCKDDEARKTHLSLQPFLGGPNDFLDPPKFSSNWAQHADYPRNRGIASEVIHYWERHTPQSFDPQNPTLESLAYYPFKIVAAEWAKYIAVMQHCIKLYEYHGDQTPNLEQFDTDLHELQNWRRRGMVSKQKVRFMIRQLKSRAPSAAAGGSGGDIQHLIEDLEMLSNDIKNAGKLLENMLPVVTSLVQIMDARQSFAETTNISRLTILALIFVPLSFVASLFSMNDENSPGGPQFWVYFAVAVPLTLLVFIAARMPLENIARTTQWLKRSREKLADISHYRNAGNWKERDASDA